MTDSAGRGADDSLRTLALRALDAGLNPLPPVEDGTKQPRSVLHFGKYTWKHFQSEHVTVEQIDKWYLVDKCMGIGLVTGRISRLELMEFDDWESYVKYKQTCKELGYDAIVGALEGCYLERTPGGGVHWLFRIDEPGPSTKLATRLKLEHEFTDRDRKAIAYAEARGKTHRPIKTLIEVKGEGGYVVIAPSGGRVHPSGKPYELLSGSLETIVTLTPDERDALYDLARTFNETPPEKPVPAKTTRYEKRSDADAESVRPGTDFNERGTWKEVLTGWHEVCTMGSITYWRRPGKGRGHSATTGYMGHDVLHVFTSSTEFTPGENYTKFHALAILEHGGDFSACAKDLITRGYGTPTRPRGRPKDSSKFVKTKSDKLSYTHDPDTSKDAINSIFARAGGDGPRGDSGSEPPPTATNGDGHATGEPGLTDEGSGGGDDHDRRVKAPAARPRRNNTDIGNAERLVDRYGPRIRYVHAWKQWLIWDGRRWARDENGTIDRLGIIVIRSIKEDAIDDDDLEWAHQSENHARLDAMIKVARNLKPVPASIDTFDQHPFLFNCPNRTIDLSVGGVHGEARDNERDDMLTQLCPTEFDPEAECPRWIEFLLTIFGGDWELIRYFQRICGISITGSVEHQILPVLYGVGANGKSTVINTLMGVIGGDYSDKAPGDMLMYRRFKGHPTELTTLYGKRLMIASETEQYDRLSEALVKELTGSEAIAARRMRENFWTFKPTHKIWLATNYRPQVGTGEAIWRRIKLIPFDVKIPESLWDLGLSDRLIRDEAPGILNWCIEGCRDWIHDLKRIEMPEAVSTATGDYRQEIDPYKVFIDEWCIDLKRLSEELPGNAAARPFTDDDIKIRASDFYNHYRLWCRLAGERPVSGKTFGLDMKKRFRPGHDRVANWFHGVEINWDTQEMIKTHDKRMLSDYNLQYYHLFTLSDIRSATICKDWRSLLEFEKVAGPDR